MQHEDGDVVRGHDVFYQSTHSPSVEELDRFTIRTASGTQDNYALEDIRSCISSKAATGSFGEINHTKNPTSLALIKMPVAFAPGLISSPQVSGRYPSSRIEWPSSRRTSEAGSFRASTLTSYEALVAGGDKYKETLVRRKDANLQGILNMILAEHMKQKLAATYYQTKNTYFLYFPIMMITVLSAVMSILSTSEVVKGQDTKIKLGIAVSFFQILLSVIQSLSKQLNYGARAGYHKAAAVTLKKILDESMFSKLEDDYRSLYTALKTNSKLSVGGYNLGGDTIESHYHQTKTGANRSSTATLLNSSTSKESTFSLDEKKDDDDDDDDDDEYNVTLEEIENTLEDGSKGDDVDDDDDDGKDSEESDNEIEDEDRKEARTESTDDSEIYHCRGAHLVSLFVRTFFRTIRRDWGSMDKYRIDKFYTLIRFMMHEIYEYLSVRSWNYGIVLLLNDAIFAEILKQPPNGLRYHLIDLCLEELAKVSAKAKTPLTEEKFLDVLEPFFALSQTGRDDDTIQERVMEKVIDNFLENYCVVSEKALQEDENDDEDDKKTDKSTSVIFKDVHVRSIAEFLFTLGSDPDTKDKYRKSLYESHKKFIRRLKKIGKDVVITEDEDGNEIYDDDSDGNVDVDDVNLNNIDKSIEFLEAETNDVIPSDPNDDLGHEDIDRNDDENAMDDKPAEEVKKEPKKKKKKKRKSIEQNDHKESDDIQNISDDAVKEKKKKKSKTKEVAADEEVVITLTEQQHAKKRDRMAKKKVMEQKEEEKESADKDTDKSGEKHVSFGKKNRAKSHKASMKALKTAEPPSTKETVPEKGILRKNPKHKSTTSTSFLSKKRRKKAASYF